jgi:hypothetical protein
VYQGLGRLLARLKVVGKRLQRFAHSTIELIGGPCRWRVRLGLRAGQESLATDPVQVKRVVSAAGDNFSAGRSAGSVTVSSWSRSLPGTEGGAGSTSSATSRSLIAVSRMFGIFSASTAGAITQ